MARQTERLTDFLAREYAIAADGVAPAKRGYYGQTWRVDAGGHGYFVKIVALRSHQPVYRRSFPVIEHLNGRGVDFISKIVKASDGRLWADYGGATLGVFEWIDGANVQN
ncbi:MAG: hypothetical protein GX558_02170, partial [Clostridiales bacterium]|nr:hypothetical protein [Clostridiales bacterium]